MKNPLAVITNKPAVRKVTNAVTTYVKEHEGAILTGGSIGFNFLGIITTYRNSPKIHEIIRITKERLYSETDVNERRRITKEGFKELVPLITPIVSFFAVSTTCSIVNHKRSEAKITMLTEALGMAKITLSEYEAFKKGVKKEIGEEKYNEIRDEMNTQKLDNYIQNSLFVPNPNEDAIWFPAIGQFFSSTPDRIDAVFERINGVLDGTINKSYGHYTVKGAEAISLGDICEDLEVKEIPQLAYSVWYDAGKTSHIGHHIGAIYLYGKSYTCLEIDDPDSLY